MKRKWFPYAGLAVGVWALLPKFSGPVLNTSDRVEIADHVVPGIVILAVSAAAVLVARRRSGSSGTPLFVIGLVVALAGLWMTATHVPLVAQASRDEVPWDGAVYHSLPGLAVLLLGLAWAAAYWSEAAPADA